ncbi:MAG: tetratricopeptide repeat protein [Planctomycetaceae bacterium]
MTRILALLLLLPLLARAGDDEESIRRFRLKKEPLSPIAGYVSAVDDDGFKFRALGFSGSTTQIRWEDVVEEDARAMRIEFRLEMTDDDRLGLIPGHRLWFFGGGFDEGLLLKIDDDGRHWLKVKRLVLPYPQDRVERVEEIKISENEVYDEQELYTVRLSRTPPSTARQHKDLADYMFESGYFDKARDHYEQALAADPSLGSELAGRLEELKELAKDVEMQVARAKAGYFSNILNDFDRALGTMREYLERYPDRERSVVRVLRDIEQRRQEKYQERFNHLKHRASDHLIRRYLERNKPEDVNTAISWVTSKLPEEIEKAVRAAMGISAEEYTRFLATRGKGALHFASYGPGSFVVDPRARRGKSSPKEIRGDPNDWWRGSADVTTRTSFLRALAAERLTEIFEMMSVRTSGCTSCGGTGQVRKQSMSEVKGVGHEWSELCPRCFGAREDRGVAFR